MSSSNFAGEEYDFAAGAIKGLRDWHIDEQGRLRGVTHPAIWRPGENVAVCKNPGGRYLPCPKRYSGDAFPLYGMPTCDDPSCTPRGHFLANETKHHFDPNCECGFWAYDEMHHTEHGNITGVIEGYGKTTIGTKGFRCEKARIVALCRDHEDGMVSLSEWQRLQRLYPDAGFFNDYDEMITAHGAVLRAWDEPGEDFWDEPARADVTAAGVSMQAMINSYSAQIASLSSTYARGGYMPRSLGRWSV